MATNQAYLLQSSLPDSAYIWDLYAACITSEKVLKMIGYRNRQEKERRRFIPEAFRRGDPETLEAILQRNLEIIRSSKVIPLQAAPYIKELRRD